MKGADLHRWDLRTEPGSRCGPELTGGGQASSLQSADKGQGCRSDSSPRGSRRWPGSAAGNVRLDSGCWSRDAGRKPERGPSRCLDGAPRVGYDSRNEGINPRSGGWQNPRGLLHTHL